MWSVSSDRDDFARQGCTSRREGILSSARPSQSTCFLIGGDADGGKRLSRSTRVDVDPGRCRRLDQSELLRSPRADVGLFGAEFDVGAERLRCLHERVVNWADGGLGTRVLCLDQFITAHCGCIWRGEARYATWLAYS